MRAGDTAVPSPPDGVARTTSTRGAGRLRRALADETALWAPRVRLAQAVTRVFPPFTGNTARAVALRRAGFAIGRGTVIFGPIRFTGSAFPAVHVIIGADVVVNVGCLLDAAADITIGDGVSIGQDVVVLTNGHEIGPPSRRAGQLVARPVRIEDGAWLSTRVVVLPGVTIGEGAVVAAGAVVTRSVAPHTLVAGVPARPLRELPR